MMFVSVTKKILVLFAVIGLAACGALPSIDSILPDRKVEYKKQKQAEKNLEVPPDLTQDSSDSLRTVPDITPAGTATYSDYTNERADDRRRSADGRRGVLPEIDKVTIIRDRDQRWLVVQAGADDVWAKVTAFWEENGIPLQEQDASVGVMRTTWIENTADVKTDLVTDFLGKVLGGPYPAATRDQYRVRLEQGEKPGITEIFLTHQGMEKKIMPPSGSRPSQPVWISTGVDHELEAEMLRRLMLYFGVEERRAAQALARQDTRKTRSQLIRDHDQVRLRIDESFARAWRLTGMALDQGGFAMDDRNRDKGIYYVRYNDPEKDKEKPGVLSKLAFWRDEEKTEKENRYQVAVRSEEKGSQVVVLDSKGGRDNSETAARILTLLHEQIK